MFTPEDILLYGLFLFILGVLSVFFVVSSSFAQTALIFLHWVNFPPRQHLASPQAPNRLSSWIYPGIKRQVSNIKVVMTNRESLGAWFIRSSTSDEAKTSDVVAKQRSAKLVFYCHGNAGTRAVSHRVRLYEYLTNNTGTNVFAFDYRGFADSTKIRPTADTIVQDAHAALEHALASTDVKLSMEQVVVFGHSLGTAVATKLCMDLTANGTPPAGLVLEAAFTTLPDVVASMFPFSWLGSVGIRQVIDNYLIYKLPSIERIKSVGCPVLFVHGKNDTQIPVQHSQELHAALHTQRNDMKLLLIEKAGHDNCCDFDAFKQTVNPFIKKCLSDAR